METITEVVEKRMSDLHISKICCTFAAKTSHPYQIMLEDIVLSDSVHYEQHALIADVASDEPIRIEGVFGAALLCALLVDTEEGNRRAIAVDSEQDKAEWIQRYEREVRRDGWGLIEVEVKMLADAYEQLAVSEGTLNDICHHNVLLLDLAYSLLVHYMNHLVKEQYGAHIWEYTEWENPFSQWLIKAVYDESIRQAMLHINWLDPAIVSALPTLETPTTPTMSFEGEAAEDIMRRYYDWLWSSIVAQTSELPDAKIQLDRAKQAALHDETHFAFLNDEIARMTPKDQILFRKWMSGWMNFIRDKLTPAFEQPTDQQLANPKARQVLFPDNITPLPNQNARNRYTLTSLYIAERCRYDEPFRKYYQEHNLIVFSQQLTYIFGWFVDANALGKNINRAATKLPILKKKYKK